MARHVEPLHGGVWSAPDPSLLKPGQLSAGRNFVYLGGSPAIFRSWGRAVFGTVSASAVDVNGLRAAQFDEGDHILIAAASASYLTAVVSADTGTFGVLTAGLAGVPTQLDSVQYRNRHYLLPGITKDPMATIGTNGCLYTSAAGAGVPPSLRQHGMSPVRSSPSITTGSGTFSTTVTGGYYEYWTTEIANFTEGARNFAASAHGSATAESNSSQSIYRMESTFDSTPGTAWISSQSVVPTIAMPVLANPSVTTHWRIYRSPMKAASTDREFPIGYMVGELAAAGASAVTSFADSGVAASAAWSFPASANASAAYLGSQNPWYAAEWASATAMYASGAGFASAAPGKRQGMYAFAAPTASGPVHGLEVSVTAYVEPGAGNHADLRVWVCPNRQSPFGRPETIYPYGGVPQYRMESRVAQVTATASASAQVVTFGGSTDRWFASNYPSPLTMSDINPKFMIVLENGLQSGKHLFVDAVAFRTFYGAVSESTIQFPSVVYTYGDEVIQVGKNGEPPSSSTGDMFQGCLVVNDLSDPSLLRYSYPDEPDSFPSTYYLNFETRENDAIKLIKVVNNRLIVGLGASLWRVNYLPSERDAVFDRGKTMEAITRDYGVVNPMCACTFSPDGPTEYLAFVSNQGVHYTDGYNLTTLTDGVDWRTDVLSTSSTSTPIALINDKENCILRFYYRNDALGDESYMCLPLCYGAGHWANGQAKVGGMLHVRNYGQNSYLSQWGKASCASGTATGEFKSNYGVCVNDNNDVYVADTSNNRIQMFTKDGAFVTSWGPSSGVVHGHANGQLYLPYAIAASADGTVFVADTYNERIQQFSVSGTYVTSWGKAASATGTGPGEFCTAVGIAADRAGFVYVADQYNHRVQKFSSNGTYVSALGTVGVSGTAAGVFYRPYGVCVDLTGNIFVSDLGNNRIQKFTSAMAYATSWGPSSGVASGSGLGQFQLPIGISVDVTGNVYVADNSNCRIQKFNNDGVYLASWGASGSGNGEFDRPAHCALGVSGEFYVADRYLNRIQKFDVSTTAFAPLKSVWQLDRENGSVDFMFGYGIQSNSATGWVSGSSATAMGAGKVYREGGTTIPSLDSTLQYTTRRMYLAGLSKEWRLNEVYGYTGSYTGGPVVTYTAKNTKTNGTGEATVGAKSITLAGQQLHKVNFQQMNEGLRLVGQVTASAYRQEMLVLDGENFGLEDSGR
jgi:sugar lactone lactonase YvrE